MLSITELRRPTPLRRSCGSIALAIVLGTFGVADAALPTDFVDQEAVGGLNQPVAFAFLPDGRLLIAEQATHLVRLAVNGAATTILSVPEVSTGGERGLLGIAVDPQWPTRPYVYLMHTRTPNNVSYVVRFKAGGDLTNPASANLTLTRRLILLGDIPDNAGNHNGGGLHFAPDGMLYVSLGEDSDPCGAQNFTLLKGCILRLKVDALSDTFGITTTKPSITPPDNPWVGLPDPNSKLLFAKGLRNPFSFSVDSMDGRLYLADVGESTYEEIDECSGGENFGWPQFEGPAAYAGYSGACPATNSKAPVAWFDRTALPNSSIVGAPIYHPVLGGIYSFPREYDGDCFYAEYYAGWIRHIRRDVNNTWQPVLNASGQPAGPDWGTDTWYASQLATGPDGALYYCKQFGPPSIRRIAYTGAQAGVGEGGADVRPSTLRVYPNPLPRGGATVRLQFRMTVAGQATLALLDISGRHVKTLRQGYLDPGPAEAQWDATDEYGRPVPAGVYFARLSGSGHRETARVVVAPR